VVLRAAVLPGLALQGATFAGGPVAGFYGTKSAVKMIPKGEPVFRKDHAPTITWSDMTIGRKFIPL
jgi:hypothetical protein